MTTRSTSGGLPGQRLQTAHPPELLAEWLDDSRQRTLRLVEDLADDQLLVPHLPTINPLLWELGHLAWFTERWVLRRHGGESVRSDADALYDSSAVAHATRWHLPLPSRRDTLAYLDLVRRRVRDGLDRHTLGPADTYFVLLSIFHEDMHGEAFAITRQTLGYAAPRLGPGAAKGSYHDPADVAGDVQIPGGRFLLGALPAEPFVFDNEKWAHPVDVKPFAIRKTCVTQAEYLAFVEDGGYARKDVWGDDGWRWRESAAATHPVYWRRDGTGWLRRDFDRWRALEPELPVLHVCWYEAEAYCRWARRRLPTEAEWEVASAARIGVDKHRFPWGDELPHEGQANVDGRQAGCVPVSGCADGDSAWGCRQMAGNAWEWTASAFTPYPGFAVDPYEDYSRPWFGTHQVLRGGCWLTRARLLRNTYRNFYQPDRRDVWAGFRTCALVS